MPERTNSDQGEGWRAQLNSEMGSWGGAAARRIDPSYYDALQSVEHLRGYAASGRLDEDIARGLQVTREIDAEERSGDSRDKED